jgi:hypothetical protein
LLVVEPVFERPQDPARPVEEIQAIAPQRIIPPVLWRRLKNTRAATARDR